MESTKKEVAEERGGLRFGRVCIDQTWTWRRHIIKFVEKNCGECCMNVELMSTLRERSRSCVRLGSTVGEYFEVMQELRQGCEICPWHFTIFYLIEWLDR